MDARDADEPTTRHEGEQGDSQSDPALDEGAADWSGEGGAVPEGPATDPDDADADADAES